MKTPCIKVCKVSEGKCLGCGRTLEQIRLWSKYTEEERERIMEKVKMDYQIALNLIQEDYNESDYEPIEEWVDDGHWKHDLTQYYSIFLRKSDNTFWKVSFMSSYNEGLDEDSVEFHGVNKKEVTLIKWVSK